MAVTFPSLEKIRQRRYVLASLGMPRKEITTDSQSFQDSPAGCWGAGKSRTSCGEPVTAIIVGDWVVEALEEEEDEELATTSVSLTRGSSSPLGGIVDCVFEGLEEEEDEELATTLVSTRGSSSSAGGRVDCAVVSELSAMVIELD